MESSWSLMWGFHEGEQNMAIGGETATRYLDKDQKRVVVLGNKSAFDMK